MQSSGRDIRTVRVARVTTIDNVGRNDTDTVQAVSEASEIYPRDEDIFAQPVWRRSSYPCSPTNRPTGHVPDSFGLIQTRPFFLGLLLIGPVAGYVFRGLHGREIKNLLRDLVPSGSREHLHHEAQIDDRGRLVLTGWSGLQPAAKHITDRCF